MQTKLLLTTILSSIAFLCYAQDSTTGKNYYYYQGRKIILNINKKRVVAFFEKNDDFENKLKKEFKVQRKIKNDRLCKTNKTSGTTGCEIILKDNEKYDEVFNLLKKRKEIISVGYVIGDSLPTLISNSFYVKLKNEGDTTLLKMVSQKTKVTIIRQVHFDKYWYVLEPTKESNSNCLDVSNYFYETNYFEKVDPGFVFNFTSSCVSDTEFYNQWALVPDPHLVNPNVCINACDAWQITKGASNIKVAVFDDGIDTAHIEFQGVNFTASYDADYHTPVQNPAQMYNGIMNHGTHVCGIICANHNYYKMAGVAPGVSIMQISHPFNPNPSEPEWYESQDYAAGIRWAADHGADVINNSWGDHGHDLDNIHSQILEDQIDYALTQGRNGKGCVVVFVSGNYAEPNIPEVDYPGNYRPEILTVGAARYYGWHWGWQDPNFKIYCSGWGPELDIVAPGEDILSTVPDDEFSDPPHSTLKEKSGTSFAAPHASAVAALILSVTPGLTGQQVVNIIESTAQKVGDYHYLDHFSDSIPRPNGTWNSEMGYGLLDAAAALKLAICTSTIENVTISSNITYEGCNSMTLKNITVENGGSLTINNINSLFLTGSFTAKIGSTLSITP
jgi:subtilisin family serine protease